MRAAAEMRMPQLKAPEKSGSEYVTSAFPRLLNAWNADVSVSTLKRDKRRFRGCFSAVDVMQTSVVIAES